MIAARCHERPPSPAGPAGSDRRQPDAVATGDVTTLAAQTSQLRAAREAMSNALANTELLLNMLRSVGLEGT
jgi:hypothetical protein